MPKDRVKVTVRHTGMALSLIGVVFVLASCDSSSPSKSSPTSTTPATHVGATDINTAQVAGLGTVLVNAQGRTLYTFVPDKAEQVTCTGSCATIWPPLKVPSTEVTGTNVQSNLIGTDPDPAGGYVATYAYWPLYTYTADTAPGIAKGQGVNSSGGLWYVISPSGKVVKTSAPAR